MKHSRMDQPDDLRKTEQLSPKLWSIQLFIYGRFAVNCVITPDL